MDAGTSTLNHSFSTGHNHLPHGNPQTQGASSSNHGPGPGTSSAPIPEEQQQHHKPFFYIQPSQPFLPMQGVQWPMPLAMPLNYNPYYGGYPGFGYGLPLMPHYQPNPYMETPGFIMPHTHHHLMDYRRMLNPQYYQSMAYHARRLRYQHNVPSRGVTNSEVQTEPLPTSQQTSPPRLSNLETSNESSNLSTVLSVPKDDCSLALKDLAPLSTNATPQKESFVIETEEVTIKCCTTPAGLQVLHSRETSEMAHSFSRDVVHCSSLVQGGLLPEDNLQGPNSNGKMEKSRPACPDILLVGTPNVNAKMPVLETTPTNHLGSKMVTDVEPISFEKDLKVVHLPFNAKYLDELRKMESTVWSTEDTLVPSPELLIESCSETLPGELPSAEMLVLHEDSAQDEVVPIVEMPMMMLEELQDVVPTSEIQADDLLFEDGPIQVGITNKLDIEHSPKVLLSDESPLDENMQDQQDTSFESLPAYLPSTSWLADFGNVRYCKMPPTPQKLNKPLGNKRMDVQTRRRKLDSEFKEVTAIRKPKEKYKPKGKVDRRSLSDHECCVSQNYNENVFVPYAMKGRRLCTRCLSKKRVYNTPSPGIEKQVLKRKVAPFQQWNDVILSTCDTCKGHSDKRFTRKDSSPDSRMETEGESSEKGACGKWRLMEETRKELKRPLATNQNVEKCPVAGYPKSRENWHRICHCPHGNAIQEMDENRVVPIIQEKWRNGDQMYLAHKWQREKPWKTVPGHNTEGLKNDLRAQNLNMHRISLPLSQGVHRKDTRC